MTVARWSDNKKMAGETEIELVATKKDFIVFLNSSIALNFHEPMFRSADIKAAVAAFGRQVDRANR